MRELPIRIVITGPESTGKSTLSHELGKHYQSRVVPEYAREYINKLNEDYNYNDILHIAKGQLSDENELAKKGGKFLFCDTGLIVLKIWCDVKYGKCHSWIEEKLQKNNYNLFLLCKPDIDWTPDPQREHPFEREKLFNLYLLELESRNLPFFIVKGKVEKRLQRAIEFIDSKFIG